MTNDLTPEQEAALQEQSAEVLEFKPRVIEGGQSEQAEGLTIPEPEFHTLLEVWQKVLEPALKERRGHVTPQWATKMVGIYPGLTFADMNDLRDLYYDRLIELYDVLVDVIKSDKDCTSYANKEDDVKHNTKHYLFLLGDWQKRILQWELDWDCESPNAPLDLAAISEVHKIYFSAEGITPWLDQIGFVYTEDDQKRLAEELEAQKEANSE